MLFSYFQTDFRMKKILFALLFMITVGLSFCKKEECKTSSSTEVRTTTYTEIDSLSPFKGQNTLNFLHTVRFVTSSGSGCGHGGCISGGLDILNLTNKKVKIKVFASERDIQFNQPHRIILECSPKELLSINDASLAFLGCYSDLPKIIQVSYN